MTHDEFLSICAKLLDASEATPETEHWLIDENGNDDDENFCYDCLMLRFAFAEHEPEPGEDYWYTGFNMWAESDSVKRCDDCGTLLGYTLTDYGVDSEIENYLEYPFDWDDPVECFEVNRILNGVYSAEQRRNLVKILKRSRNKPAELSNSVRVKKAEQS